MRKFTSAKYGEVSVTAKGFDFEVSFTHNGSPQNCRAEMWNVPQDTALADLSLHAVETIVGVAIKHH
jgi:hypothetical protein